MPSGAAPVLPSLTPHERPCGLPAAPQSHPPQHPLQALGGQAVQLLGENVDELMLTAAPGVQSRPTR